MGMYTAISLGIELKKNTPSDVIDVLEYMVYGRCETRAMTYATGSVHPFFNASRWPIMLQCDSYYFDWQSGYKLNWDSISKAYYLTGVSNLKNYSNDIALFLNWLGPYIETNGFIGWTMYEEDNIPTLLFRDQDSIKQLVPDHTVDYSHLLQPINPEVWI